jgi:uncharacterized CHY-type Zn-finger protein
LIDPPATKSLLLHQNAKVVLAPKRCLSNSARQKRFQGARSVESPNLRSRSLWCLNTRFSLQDSIHHHRFQDILTPRYYHSSRYHAILQHSVAPLRRHPFAPHSSSCTRPSSTLSSRKRRCLSPQTYQYPPHLWPGEPLLVGLFLRETSLWE